VATPIQVLVPDIGGFKDVDVIDVLVKDGQQIEKETPLITLETEKAAMDVPAPEAGKITQIKLKTGDKVSEGSLILLLEARAEPDAGGAGVAAAAPAQASAPAPAISGPAPKGRTDGAAAVDEAAFSRAYASPSVRKFARELGADLGKITGSGPHGRIVKADVEAARPGAAAPVSAPTTAPRSSRMRTPIAANTASAPRSAKP